MQDILFKMDNIPIIIYKGHFKPQRTDYGLSVFIHIIDHSPMSSGELSMQCLMFVITVTIP